jgi:hypothetical protein
MCALLKRNTSLDAEKLELRGALNTLYDLLEAHAPTWYTEADHDKAADALHCRGQIM